MHLTMIKGGKPAANTARQPVDYDSLTTQELILVQRSTIEELVLKFNELQEAWEETKYNYRRTVLEQAAERRNRALSAGRGVNHV